MNQYGTDQIYAEKVFEEWRQKEAEKERQKADADAAALQQQMVATAQSAAAENQPSNEPSQEGGGADSDMLNLEGNEAEDEEDRTDGAAQLRR